MGSDYGDNKCCMPLEIKWSLILETADHELVYATNPAGPWKLVLLVNPGLMGRHYIRQWDDGLLLAGQLVQIGTIKWAENIRRDCPGLLRIPHQNLKCVALAFTYANRLYHSVASGNGTNQIMVARNRVIGIPHHKAPPSYYDETNQRAIY